MGEIKLAISLHESDDVARSAIMPVNRKYQLDELLEASLSRPLPKPKSISPSPPKKTPSSVAARDVHGAAHTSLTLPKPKLLQACRYYVDKTGRRISFEWALIAGQNDDVASARALGKRLKGLRGFCHVNLIPLNPTKGFGERRVGTGAQTNAQNQRPNQRPHQRPTQRS